ncbi:MAG: hypothetical protein LC723_13410 [Actinobacteria bacterium]|nr:hypothetical protein [Actinomycetota bacterium]
MTVENDVIKMLFKRVGRGLLVTVRTDPRIEDYMKGLGADMETLSVDEYGRMWIPANEGESLSVYGLPAEDALTGYIRNGTGASYRLDQVGRRLFEGGADGDRPNGVNLSFLRLVGSSRPEGVSFIVQGVYSVEAVREFKKTFADAAEGFYKNFLKPVSVQVIVSTQEAA